MQAFGGRMPRRQNSIEALNKEIDMFTSIGAAPFEPKVSRWFGLRF